jgi:hypothetical protein
MGFNNNFNSSGGATVLTDLEVDGTTLVVDETNNRVGVGLSAPKTALTVEGPVTLKEQASADGDTAAYGQLWVKTATPNELYFTTDAGNDVQITSGTSIVAPASAVSMANGSDNRITTATGAAALNGEASLTFDGNTLTVTDAVTDTNAGTFTAVDINFDKTGASTSNNTMIGINLDMDNTTATDGTNAMTGIKVTPTLTHAATAGTTLVKGAEIVATGSGPGNTTTRALDITATGADFNQGIFMAVADGGVDIKMLSSADSGDHCTIATGAAGATTLTTTDDDGANADLTFSIDGSFDVTATSMSLSSDLTVTGGDITLGAAADANNTALVAVTESGTNIDGKTLTIGGGLGTGTGLPGSVSITSGIPGGSGSSAHNATTVATFSTFGPTLNYGGVDALANDESVGEKVFFGTGQTVKGKLYCLNTSGAWVLTDADVEATTAALIAVACGGDGTGSANDALTNGMLIRGFIDNASALTGTFNEGIPIYVDTATAGNMTVTRPSASGDFVRVVGWACATGNVIYFNPSNDYIEL